MPRKVPTSPLLIPQRKALEKQTAVGEQHVNEKGASFINRYSQIQYNAAECWPSSELVKYSCEKGLDALLHTKAT